MENPYFNREAGWYRKRGRRNIEQFTKIAPTVVIPYGKKPIREELREFGKMTGSYFNDPISLEAQIKSIVEK